MVYTYNGIVFSLKIKKEEILPLAATLMNVEDITLSEMTVTEGQILHDDTVR